jgi:hypothetical protein
LNEVPVREFTHDECAGTVSFRRSIDSCRWRSKENPMKKMLVTGLAGLMALGSVAVPASAQVAGTRAPVAAAAESNNGIETVQRRYYDDRRYRYDRRHRHYRDRGSNVGVGVAAGVLGLAAGAAIASSANRNRDADYEFCASRFQTWNPRTGLYLGADGRQHACP